MPSIRILLILTIWLASTGDVLQKHVAFAQPEKTSVLDRDQGPLEAQHDSSETDYNRDWVLDQSLTHSSEYGDFKLSYNTKSILLSPSGRKSMIELEKELEVFTKQTGTYADLKSSDRSDVLFLEFASNRSIQHIATYCDWWTGRPSINFASPCFKYNESKIYLKNQLLVRFNQPAKNLNVKIVKFSQENSLEFLQEYNGIEGSTYLFQSQGLSPFELWKQLPKLRAHLDISSIQINYIYQLQAYSAPNDPGYLDQWYLNSTSSNPGVESLDVGAEECWDLSTGSADITIAILDEGVDVLHPDLVDNMLPGYDASNQASPGGLAGNADPLDAHGTACAGIAAASGNNMQGGAGLSWNCKILPVRMGFGSHWTETAWIIDSLIMATDLGADIISASWGGTLPSSAEENSILYAKQMGRNQLGCSVLFAVGNSNNSIAYPAAYPSTFAIGATSQCDERKSLVSCDGVNWWGSNFGPELDIVAPGVFMYTTDNQGAGGFTNGDYFEFEGTSSSCPLVAGGIGLLLSLYPNLPVNLIEESLRSSALDMVGIPQEDTAGFDEFMGWGRFHAYEFLLEGGLLAQEVFIRGDANADGAVLADDSLRILDYLFFQQTLDCKQAGDVSDDGVINLTDAVQLLNYLFLGGASPASPFPNPGLDPSLDSLDCI